MLEQKTLITHLQSGFSIDNKSLTKCIPQMAAILGSHDLSSENIQRNRLIQIGIALYSAYLIVFDTCKVEHSSSSIFTIYHKPRGSYRGWEVIGVIVVVVVVVL